MKLWKRNAIAAAIVLFVCGAVYMILSCRICMSIIMRLPQAIKPAS